MHSQFFAINFVGNKKFTMQPDVMFKAEVLLVKELGENIGYGNMMAIASSLWRKSMKDDGSPISGCFVPAVPDAINDEWESVNTISCSQYDNLVEAVLS